MPHDLEALHALTSWLADNDPPSTGTPTSVIGLIIITVPATITAIALLLAKVSKMRGRPQDEAPPAPVPPADPLNSDEVDAITGSAARVRLAVLTRWFLLQRLNPDKIVTGEEHLDELRIP